MIAAAIVCVASLASAQSVNIVYPIDGRTYPIMDPSPGALHSAYFTSSFGVTCPGGGHAVKWGFDKTVIGTAQFYDQISEQQVWKLPGGAHVFWVDAGKCGTKRVKFMIGR